jgi:hypothetical protein
MEAMTAGQNANERRIETKNKPSLLTEQWKAEQICLSHAIAKNRLYFVR